MLDRRTSFLDYIRNIAIPLPFVIVIALFSTVLGVYAATGTTDSPDTPANTNSYTLEDIYQRLDVGTDGSQSTFTEPSVAPGTGSMHTLDQIMGIAPELDASGATADDVLATKTFWGLTSGEWGLQTGSIAAGSDVSGADGSKTFSIPDGIYRSKTATCNDSDLIAKNIKYGVEIFGVTGAHLFSSWSLHTTTAEATALTSIYMLSTTDGWAVGNLGRIYHYDGTNWSLHTTTAEQSYFTSIYMLSTTDGWAVGQFGHIYHYDGTNWSLHTTTAEGTELTSIYMLSTTVGWAVGDLGRIYPYDGTNWSLHTSTAEGLKLYSVYMLSATDGWAVDHFGRIYRYR